MENITPQNQAKDETKTPFNCEYQIKQGKFGWFQYTKTKTTLNLNIVDDTHFRNMKDIISLMK